MRRRWARALAGAALLLLLLGAVRHLYPPLRHPLDALLLAQALLAGEEKSWLARWTPSPVRRDDNLGGFPLDFHLPSGSGKAPRGCVLLAHGMTDLGRRDPRLVAFARILARLGFAVAVPELPGMRGFRPDEADVARLAAAFAWLDGQRAPAPPRCGLIGFSFSAGPVLLAAAKPGVRERVGYAAAAGAYFGLRGVLRHLTTGGRGEEPAFPGGPPVRAGKWLFLRYNAGLLGLQGYEAEVESIVRAKLREEGTDVSAIAARLPERARRVLALMENRDPARFDGLFRAQPPDLIRRVEAWSLEGAAGRGRFPLFLLHGRRDPFIPPSESLRLAEEARRAPGRPVRLLILDALGHVDPAQARFSLRAVTEGVRLFGFLSEVLSAMEGG